MTRYLTIVCIFFAFHIHAQDTLNIDSLRINNFLETQSYPDSIITYDADGSRISIEYYSPNPNGPGVVIIDGFWDDQNETWILNAKTIRQYDIKGRIIYGENYYWDSSNNAWIGVDKYFYAFDQHENQTLYEYYYWDAGGEKWIGYGKSITSFDDLNRALFNESYTWDHQEEVWIGMYKAIYGYDEFGNQNVYEQYGWDNTQQTWRLEQIYTQSFLADGTIYEKETYQLDHSTGILFLQEKIEPSFDASGRIEEINTSNRSDPNEELVAHNRYNYLYDENGHLQYRFIYLWDNTLQTFENFEKRAYTANEQGLPAINVSYQWSNSAWMPNDSIEYIYDSAGHVMEQKKHVWVTNAWRNSSWNITHYDNNNNNILTESYTWDLATGSWKGANKMVYAYDSNKNLILSEYYRWNASTRVFYVSSKYIYIYDEFKNKILSEYYNWSSAVNGLIGTEKKETTYNSFNKLVSEIQYGWNNTTSDWVTYSQMENTYDEHGNLVTNSSFEWDSSTSQWVKKTGVINTYDEKMRMVRTEHYNLNSTTSELLLDQYLIYYYSNLDISEDDLSFTSTGDGKTIQITSNGNWVIESMADWLTITPMSGTGNAEIRITAKENNTSEARSTTIVVRYPSSSFELTQLIQVDQEGKVVTPPLIYHDVIILPATGAGTRPIPGTYWTEEGTSFTIDISVNEGFEASQIKLRINDRFYTPTRLPGRNEFTYTIAQVLEIKEIEVVGLKPIPPVGNEGVNNAIQVHTFEKALYIQTPYPTEVFIYTILGKKYMHSQLSAGNSTINLPSDIYIVVVDNKSYKIIIK